MNIKDPRIEDIGRIFGFLAIVLFLLVDPFGIIPADVLAQDQSATEVQDNTTYEHIIDALVKIFILAVLIEIALSVVFQWRLFLRHAEGKGLKVPISFIISLVIVIAHQIDLPGEVVSAFGDTPTKGKVIGYLISALIIAGGSSSVNSIFESLGWRNPLSQKIKAEQEQQKIQGRLLLQVTRPAGGTSENQLLMVNIDGKTVGTIPPGQNSFGDQNGHVVVPGRHRIDVSWMDQGGNEQTARALVVVPVGTSTRETLRLT